MTAASSRTPRTPTYRTGRAPEPWHREHDANFYTPRHKAHPWTAHERTVPAIVERVR